MPDTDLLSTPENYATPEQLRTARELYKDMLIGNGQQKNIISPWQGISNMVHALVGGYGLSQTAKQERSSDIADAEGRSPKIPNENGASPATTPVMPRTPGQPAQTAPAGGASLGYNPENASNAVSGIESGGKYDLLGPIIQKTGDRAYGKYQVMGQNVGQWTKEALGRSMTPQEFLGNPDAQEAVFKHKFGEYSTKYGPEGAARAWFAGEKGMNSPNRKDPLGTSVSSYSQQFQKAYGQPSGGALAFNGEPTNAPAPGAPAPMSQALAAGPGGGSIPVPRAVPPAPVPGNAVPQGVIPQRPRYTEQQIRQILASKTIPESAKATALETYQAQNQPVEMSTTGGKIIIGRDGTQHFMPETQWNPYKSPAGTEIKQPMVFNPNTWSWDEVPIRPASGAAAPAKPPLPNELPNLNYAKPEGEPGKGILNDMPPLPPEIVTGQSAPKAAPVEPPPDTTHGIDRALKGDSQKGAVPGMLNYAPPEGGDITGAVPPAAKAGAEDKMAQYSSNPTMDRMTKEGLEYKGREEAQKKEMDSYQKQVDSMSNAGRSASMSTPMLQLARKLVDNEKYYSGTGGNLVLDLKKVKDALYGTNSALSMEGFQKIVSGQVLQNLRTELEGMGQVRLKELELLQSAMASGNLTPAGNRLILDLMLQVNGRATELGQIANGYQAGARWKVDPADGKMKPVLGPDGHPLRHEGAPSQGELNGYINHYLTNKPLLSQEQIGQLNQLIASPHTYGGVGQPKYPKYAPEQPQPPKAPKQTNPPAPPGQSPAEAPPKGYTR